MDAYHSDYNTTQLRGADVVMSPQHLGAMHQTRISFVRSLIRKMAQQQWELTIFDWQLSSEGYGHVIYQMTTPTNLYHLVVFCDEIDDEDRNDRVIAEKWDVTFAFVQGAVDVNLLEQLRANVPLQEAGRNPNNVLVLARANKSVRVFDHIVDALSKGTQPKAEELASVGYILRTTAVYGNGKFGIADFKLLEDNPDFSQSFSCQMCAVYLLRHFSLDWVHYLAECKGKEKAIRLDKRLQRYLGIGNATGLGMAPYLITHPCIVDQWLTTRERAITEVMTMPYHADKSQELLTLLAKARLHLQQVITINTEQDALNQAAILELDSLIEKLPKFDRKIHIWADLMETVLSFSFETQEIILSCLMEIYPDIVDPFALQMNTREELTIPGGKNTGDLLELLEHKYQWAIKIDFSLPENTYWFWYRSQDKEEPRLGVRGEEPGEERELPLDIARQVNELYSALMNYSTDLPVAEFLLENPHYRSITRRVWTMGNRVMGDIQMNVLRKDALPMHLLRCKLSMFGATKFDPRSDRWVRVTFFQGAPLYDEVSDPNLADNWLFPIMPSGDLTLSACGSNNGGNL
ncbi:hypothetical protein [Vibrio caribbeanicus]|uniref:hypothetical protein n=1 Tax=Vibrio caribbeanicus TaxID=701175 RepID=UPI0022833504|nr:hypothetical protein [Vibrio caribbeanicus]MCY9843922.1 hypothetical protein [Vibrio caribbeanicus]